VRPRPKTTGSRRRFIDETRYAFRRNVLLDETTA
jgi:hypothetical protein